MMIDNEEEEEDNEENNLLDLLDNDEAIAFNYDEEGNEGDQNRLENE